MKSAVDAFGRPAELELRSPCAALGRFDSRARTRSAELWATTHRGGTAGTAAVAAGAAAALGSKTR